MVRKLIMTVVLALAALGVRDMVTFAQAKLLPPGKFISNDMWHKELAKSGGGTLGIVAGQSYTIVPNMVVRTRLDGPNNASVHSADSDKADVTEINLILEGSGTFMTGGTLPDAKDRTKGITGGEAHDVKYGDIIVIPPGTPHWFSKINKSVTMVEIRYPGDVTKKK